MAWYYIPPEVAKALAPYVVPIIWIAAVLGGVFFVYFGLLMVESYQFISSMFVLFGIVLVYISLQKFR